MKPHFHIPANLDRKAPHVWLASWFFCGFLSPAPGTWGSLGAIPFGIAIYALGGGILLLSAAFVIAGVGIWAAHKFDQDMNGHDSKMIVIDEVAGQWITLTAAGLDPILIIVAFVAFRLFDILKPWPVSFIDREVKGAIGVIGDDVMAGLMASLCVLAVSSWMP